jgi:hypothetical protein
VCLLGLKLKPYSSCCWQRGTKPAGLHLLLPMKQWGPWVLLTQKNKFPCHFRVKVTDHAVGGAWSPEFLCVQGSRTYYAASTEQWILEQCGGFRHGICSDELCSSHSSHGQLLLYLWIQRGLCFLLMGPRGCLLGSPDLPSSG